MKLAQLAVTVASAAILGRDRSALAPGAPVVSREPALPVVAASAERLGQQAVAVAQSGQPLPAAPPKVQAGLTVPGLLIAGRDEPRLELGKLYAVGASADGALVFSSSGGELLSVRGGELHSTVPLQAALVNAGSVVLGGVAQWTTVLAEDFAKSTEGWSHTSVTTCGGVTMLGGYCQFAQGEVTRTVSGLPAHSQLRIQATYHFIDRWVGETAFMKLNLGTDGAMVPVWTEAHAQDHEKSGLNVCGSETVHEGKFAVHIDVTVPHTQPTLQVAFGSTMDAQDPCDESWGVSSFQVSVRP